MHIEYSFCEQIKKGIALGLINYSGLGFFIRKKIAYSI